VADILATALKIVEERGESYRHPQGNFARIALMWTAYLGRTITIEDVGLMMILLKVARNNPDMPLDSKRDTGVDIAGYIHALDVAGVFPPAKAERLSPEMERKAWDSGKHFNGIPTLEQVLHACYERQESNTTGEPSYGPGM
jgi:hypothetical protein